MPFGPTHRKNALQHQQTAENVLNRAASRRPAATVCPASQRDRVLLERAADPLHRAGVNSKLFGNDADTRSPRSRQSLTDSFLECGGDWGTPTSMDGRGSCVGNGGLARL